MILLVSVLLCVFLLKHETWRLQSRLVLLILMALACLAAGSILTGCIWQICVPAAEQAQHHRRRGRGGGA